jgi:4-amino-4-deoxy-L-arabinose transferase-like glycosyltransferase
MDGWKTALLIILVAAAGLRIVSAIGCDAGPDYSDMAIYNRLALEKGIAVSPPPGYPLFLRTIYSIAGRENYKAVYIIQALISALTVWLIFLTARRVSGTTTALVAAGISALYPNFIMYNLTTMTETLALMITMLMFHATVSDQPGKKRSILSAAALFAGCIVRPAFLYFWPGMLAVQKQKRVFLIATATVVIPLAIIGMATGKASNRGALAFYKSYNPKADGKTYFDLTETEIGTRDLPSSVYLRETARFILDNKWKTIDIIYVKASKVFSRGWDNFVLRDQTEGQRFLRQLLQYAYLPVMILGFIGMIRFNDKRNRQLALPALSYLVFFILLAIFKVRYRLLIEPVLIIFTSITIGHLCRFQEYRDSSDGHSAP